MNDCDCDMCKFIGSAEQVYITEDNAEEYKDSYKYEDEEGKKYVVLFSWEGIE